MVLIFVAVYIGFTYNQSKFKWHFLMLLLLLLISLFLLLLVTLNFVVVDKCLSEAHGCYSCGCDNNSMVYNSNTIKVQLYNINCSNL